MRQPKTVRDEANLHGGRQAVDVALPDRLARLPEGFQPVRTDQRAIRADELHRDRLALAHDVEPDLLAVEPDRAAAFALHEAAGQLAGNLPLALAEHVIDGGRD